MDLAAWWTHYRLATGFTLTKQYIQLVMQGVAKCTYFRFAISSTATKCEANGVVKGVDSANRKQDFRRTQCLYVLVKDVWCKSLRWVQ